MSEDRSYRAIVRLSGEAHTFEITRSTSRERALLEELSFVRRAAQAEANIAYEDWTRSPSGGSYAVYRAAQDRADAAQDQLAESVRRTALRGSGDQRGSSRSTFQ